MNRDFKGVWIPKEIWLNKELTALDKVIFTEISSLDNEEHCSASNKYLAEFCGCSERKVSDTIRKLKDMGFIEELEFDGRYRKLRVAKIANQSSSIEKISTEGSKNCDAPSQNLLPINIDNNIANNKTYNISKDILYVENSGTEISEYESHMYSKDDFLGSVKSNKKSKKSDNLYSKCLSEIYSYTQNGKLIDSLTMYLKIRLAMKDKPIYGVNQWKGILNKLSKVIEDNPDMSEEEVVSQSIERGYASFYPVNNSKSYSNQKHNKVFAESDSMSCEPCTTSKEERIAILEKQGKRTSF